METNYKKLMGCPVCRCMMCAPIYQCEEGHAICDTCVQRLKCCLLCNASITNIRSYQLEQLIAGMKNTVKLDCAYNSKGCSYSLKLVDKDQHEMECRFGVHECAGKLFNNWPCDWKGEFAEIVEHFKSKHAEYIVMQFKTSASMTLEMDLSSKELQVVDFHEGQNIFYYKKIVDTLRQNVYFVFQMVGLEKQAKNFYYEMEIYKGDVKKLKFCNYCCSHAKDFKEIVKDEDCAVLSFKTAKHFMDDSSAIQYRFRIMKVTKK